MHLQMHLQYVCSNKLSLLNIGQFIAGCFKFMKSQWIEILAIEEIRQNKLLKNIFPLKYNIIIELSPLTYSIGCSQTIKSIFIRNMQAKVAKFTKSQTMGATVAALNTEHSKDGGGAGQLEAEATPQSITEPDCHQNTSKNLINATQHYTIYQRYQELLL